jgi:hypothetical protein
VDTCRYDVHPSKLEYYTQPDVKKLLKSKFVTGQSQEQIMKNLLNMEDSDEEEGVSGKKGGKKAPVGKKGKKQEESDDEDEGDSDDSSDGEEEKKFNKDPSKKGQGEDLRKMREQERKRREEEEKLRAEKEKRMSMFLGESHGHYKMGVFVRIELKVKKQFSRALIPEYPVILCSLR